jgi:predicted nucleic acid-binding protein
VYNRPYLDSDVFIGWIKGEKIPEKDATGADVITDRGKIAESILTLAEQQVFPIVISAITLAEVHKKKGKEKLSGDENDNVLDYFEHDFVHVVSVDRAIGEEANRLCRKYEKEGLSPNDAIHMACAKKAGCDVLLTWDKGLNAISDPDIPTERPKILDLTPPQQELELIAVKENEDEKAAKNEEQIEPKPPELPGSSGGHPEGQTAAEGNQGEGKPTEGEPPENKPSAAAASTVTHTKPLPAQALVEGDGSKRILDAKGIETSPEVGHAKPEDHLPPSS